MSSFVDITSYGNGAYKVIVVAALLIAMQILMAGGRLLSRKLRRVSLGADDYVFLIATILTFGLCALALAFPRIAGIGAPVAITPAEELLEGKILGQSFMAWLIVYGLSVALSKCAILLLYIRVFTTSNKAFTASVFVVGLIVVATGIANTFVAIFQCTPVAYEWDKTIRDGKCIDVVAFARYMTIPNVVTGAVMLIMPLPLAWRLNLELSAKMALTATLLHGIIGFVASCARLSIFFRTDTSNFTNNTSLIWTIWTINEPANYIIVASLPTLRPVFLRILPSSFFILSNSHGGGSGSGKRSAPPRALFPPQSPSPSSPSSPTTSERRTAKRRSDLTSMTTMESPPPPQHVPWTTHQSECCKECWVDIEARPAEEAGDRVAAMRAPGANNSNGYYANRRQQRDGRRDEGKDEVVVETLIQVSSAAGKFY